MMHAIYAFLEHSWIGNEVRSIPDMFAICEALHFVGLSLLMGALLVVDLRVIGVIKGATYGAVLNLVWVAMVGFALTLGTGIVFLSNNPALYQSNPAFNLKLIVIGVAGVNALWFEVYAHKRLAALPQVVTASWSLRWPALLSISIWLFVILLGRLMPTFAAVGGG
jgi:hypothetical protein